MDPNDLAIPSIRRTKTTNDESRSETVKKLPRRRDEIVDRRSKTWSELCYDETSFGVSKERLRSLPDPNAGRGLNDRFFSRVKKKLTLEARRPHKLFEQKSKYPVCPNCIPYRLDTYCVRSGDSYRSSTLNERCSV